MGRHSRSPRIREENDMDDLILVTGVLALRPPSADDEEDDPGMTCDGVIRFRPLETGDIPGGEEGPSEDQAGPEDDEASETGTSDRRSERTEAGSNAENGSIDFVPSADDDENMLETAGMG